jgi:hypothetical protein
VAKRAEDPMVAAMFEKDASKDGELASAIQQLSPAEAKFFLHRLEMAYRKRKLQITGYLVAVVAWLFGELFAFVYFGTHDGFTGWVFLVPFFSVGLILYIFGRWANAIGARPPPTE